MGRHAGDIALYWYSSGADVIVVPEEDFNINDIVDRIKAGYDNGKKHSIIVLAEGVMPAAQLLKN